MSLEYKILGACLFLVGSLFLTIFFISRRRKKILVERFVREKLMDDHSKLKVKKTKAVIINPFGSQFDFEECLDWLGENLGRTITRVEFKRAKGFILKTRPKVILHFDKVGDKIATYEKPSDLKELSGGRAILGKNLDTGRPAPINTREYNSLGIFSRSGNGKTTLIGNILVSWSDENPNGKILIADTKFSFSVLRGNPKVSLFDTTDEEGLEQFKAALLEVKAYVDGTARRVGEAGKSHIEDLEGHSAKRFLIVCEETAEWLSNPKKGELNFELRAEIKKLIEVLVFKGRSSGVVLLFSQQSALEADLPIPSSILKVAIYSELSRELAKAKLGGTFGTRMPSKYSWYVSSAEFSGFVKPYLITNDEIAEKLRGAK